MRIFENREDEALSPAWEEQVPLVRQPHSPSWLEPLTPAEKEAFPLETFPIIEDFEIVLLPMLGWGPTWRKQWEYHLGFFSQQRGLLACFGLWGHVGLDYAQEDFRIPLDFCDRDQAWDQVIFEQGAYVYILEGEAEYHTNGYYCWFRVRKEHYLAEWQLALTACRRIIRQRDRK